MSTANQVCDRRTILPFDPSDVIQIGDDVIANGSGRKSSDADSDRRNIHCSAWKFASVLEHVTSSQCQRKARICAALRVALEQEPHHLLDEQRDAARSLAHSIDHLLGERMPACYLADHAAHLRAVERRERNDAMVRAHGPGRSEFRPRGGARHLLRPTGRRSGCGETVARADMPRLPRGPKLIT